MNKQIHTFDNGLMVYSEHLLDIQRDRYKEVNLHEPEEEKVFCQLLEDVPENGIFVNVGSAIGYYLLLAKKKRPDLITYGYEPLKKHRKYFIKNIYLNGFNKKDFYLSGFGLSVQDGNASFLNQDYGSYIQLNYKRSFNDLLKRLIGNAKFSSIKTISMATLLKQVGGKIHLLQLDIQGHEKNVLEASSKELSEKSIERVLIGTHSAVIHKICLFKLMEYGYKITFENFEAYLQPDGIIVGKKNI